MAAGYLNGVLGPHELRLAVDRLTQDIRLRRLDFDAIAIRGVSGAAVGSAVAYNLGKPLMIVRKGEPAHSNRVVESPLEPEDQPWNPQPLRPVRYIVLDDFVSTGDTVRAIHAAVCTAHPGSTLVSIHCYGYKSWEDFVTLPDGTVAPVYMATDRYKRPSRAGLDSRTDVMYI